VELDALIRALAPGDVIGVRPVEILDLAYDTRRVGEGALFFCVPGATRDGHDLADDAVAAGAAALVVERPVEADVPQLVVESVRASMAVAADEFFDTPTGRLAVAGVTGTNGKSTTAYLLRSILQAEGRTAGLVGTVEWVVGGESRDAPHTTPEAIDLQRLFREMVDAGDDAVAMLG
jgi:UDP-N-acetylmuramoyl-L-alanyl-D-glutamate--2,6-diaminopimelate ligase